MKKVFLMLMLAVAVTACQKEPATKAYLDENGDCIFENSVIRFKINGASNPVVTSGMEAVLKATQKRETVIKDRKSAQAASMNDGGSALVVNDSLYYPLQNFDSFEVVEETDNSVTFKVHYPAWPVAGDSLTLTRTVKLYENSYYCEVSDVYNAHGSKNIKIAAGFAARNVEKHEAGKDYLIAWESMPGEEGYLGVGIVMPMANELSYEGIDGNAVGYYSTKYGRKADYAIGCCWSKGQLSDFELWAAKVRF